MRHRATRPFLDMLHRVPRALARPVGALSRLGSLRFAAGLVAAMVVGTGAFVAVASMGDGSEDTAAGPSATADRTGSEASRSAERPDLPETSSSTAQEGASPTPSRVPGKKRTARDAQSPSPSATEDAAREKAKDAAQDAASEAEKAGQNTPDPSGTSSAAPPPADRSAPQTRVSATYPSGDTATFSFGADEAATFSCSLDGSAFTSCTSAVTYADLDPGKHTFRVRATDTAGNVDPTPASVTWHANRGPSVDD